MGSMTSSLSIFLWAYNNAMRHLLNGAMERGDNPTFLSFMYCCNSLVTHLLGILQQVSFSRL